MDKFSLPSFSLPHFSLSDSLSGLELGDIPLDLVLIAGRAVFLVVAFTVMAMAFVRWRRAAQKDAQRIFEQLDIALSEIRLLGDQMMAQTMAQTMEMAARLDTLEERLDSNLRAAPVVSSAPQRGYETAVRIARGGAGVEQIVSMCGLTRHEAELLVRLHGTAQAAPAAIPMANDMRGAAEMDGQETQPQSLSADDAAAARQEVRRRVRSRLSVVS